ncbi:MAG: hypothetical protein GYB65_00210 [Chloroflexi bacterium]|nr:hypothetical protein [Chloroflexota bacterium]
MRQNRWLLALIVLSLGLSLVSPGLVVPVSAQDGADASTAYILNMRTGPDVTYGVVAVLEPGTALVLEGRSVDTAWVLGSTADGALRGWVASLYLNYEPGFAAANLPVSAEIISAPAPPSAAGGESGSVDGATVAVPAPAVDPAAGVLAEVPLISMIGPRAREIFLHGQSLGNNPRVFTQVGECNIRSQAYLVPFGAGNYNLGPYADLQPTIEFFNAPVQEASNSWWYKGLTMGLGYTAQVVIDATFADPSVCAAGLSLLECEYERTRPSVAIINFGLYDVYWLTPALYEAALRQVVETSIDYGVIPVLTTFPTCPGDTSNWPSDAATRNQNRAAFNQTVYNLSREYSVPLVNLWRATQPLPGCGLLADAGDFQHISESTSPAGYAAFDGVENVYGFTMWNLLTLQVLDELRVNVLQ